MFDLTGNIVVVTRASAGMGRQFALVLARQGAGIAIFARKKSESNRPEVMESMNDFIVNRMAMRRSGKDGELDFSIRFMAAKESRYVIAAILTYDGGWIVV